jgi:hypothetical protein
MSSTLDHILNPSPELIRLAASGNSLAKKSIIALLKYKKKLVVEEPEDPTETADDTTERDAAFETAVSLLSKHDAWKHPALIDMALEMIEIVVRAKHE